MLNYIGFDTIIINSTDYSESELSDIFKLFVSLGVFNFVFVYDFDLKRANLTHTLDRLKNFKSSLKPILPRGAHPKTCCSFELSNDAVANPILRRLQACKKHGSIFVTIPLFQDVGDISFATALNRLLYRKSLFPIFNFFDSCSKIAPDDFVTRLIATSKAGFAFDIEYLFDASNSSLHEMLLHSGAPIIPYISKHPSNYVGLRENMEYFYSKIGKVKYYKLCSQINKCSRLLGF